MFISAAGSRLLVVTMPVLEKLGMVSDTSVRRMPVVGFPSGSLTARTNSMSMSEPPNSPRKSALSASIALKTWLSETLDPVPAGAPACMMCTTTGNTWVSLDRMVVLDISDNAASKAK